MPLPAAALEPVEITRDNDLTFEVGPDGEQITGLNPSTGTQDPYLGATIDGRITATAASDTALGTAKTFTAISTGRFIPFFEASEVNAALTAAGTIRNGHPLFCVLKAANDFRVAIPLVYRTARKA